MGFSKFTFILESLSFLDVVLNVIVAFDANRLLKLVGKEVVDCFGCNGINRIQVLIKQNVATLIHPRIEKL